jgi:hypothetical protein
MSQEESGIQYVCILEIIKDDAAYRETQSLLARREREMADLRRRIETGPIAMRR